MSFIPVSIVLDYDAEAMAMSRSMALVSCIVSIGKCTYNNTTAMERD